MRGIQDRFLSSVETRISCGACPEHWRRARNDMRVFHHPKCFCVSPALTSRLTSLLTVLHLPPSNCFTNRSSKNCEGLALFASGIVSDRKSKIPCKPGADTINSRLKPARRYDSQDLSRESASVY